MQLHYYVLLCPAVVDTYLFANLCASKIGICHSGIPLCRMACAFNNKPSLAPPTRPIARAAECNYAGPPRTRAWP